MGAFAFGLAFLGTSSVAVAVAGTANGSSTSHTIGGRVFTGYSTVITNPSAGWARAVENVYGNYLPAGWYGAAARLYTSSGTLVVNGTVAYSSVQTTTHSAYTGLRTVPGSYYGQGTFYGWNGSNYIPIVTPRSPNQTL